MEQEEKKVVTMSTYNCRKINLYLNLQEEKSFWCNFHPTVVLQQVQKDTPFIIILTALQITIIILNTLIYVNLYHRILYVSLGGR